MIRKKLISLLCTFVLLATTLPAGLMSASAISSESVSLDRLYQETLGENQTENNPVFDENDAGSAASTYDTNAVEVKGSNAGQTVLSAGTYPIASTDNNWTDLMNPVPATNGDTMYHLLTTQNMINTTGVAYAPETIGKLSNLSMPYGFKFSTSYAYGLINKRDSDAYTIEIGDIKVIISPKSKKVSVFKATTVLAEAIDFTGVSISASENAALGIPNDYYQVTGEYLLWNALGMRFEIEYKTGILTVNEMNPKNGEFIATVYSGEVSADLTDTQVVLTRCRGWMPTDVFNTSMHVYSWGEVSTQIEPKGFLDDYNRGAQSLLVYSYPQLLVRPTTDSTTANTHSQLAGAYGHLGVDANGYLIDGALAAVAESRQEYDLGSQWKIGYSTCHDERVKNMYGIGANVHFANNYTSLFVGDIEIRIYFGKVVSNWDSLYVYVYYNGGAEPIELCKREAYSIIPEGSTATGNMDIEINAVFKDGKLKVYYGSDYDLVCAVTSEQFDQLTSNASHVFNAVKPKISMKSDYATIALHSFGFDSGYGRIEFPDELTGTVLTEALEDMTFETYEWTGDTAPGNEYNASGTKHYSGIIEGKFISPVASTRVEIATVERYFLADGFKTSVLLMYSGDWNSHNAREVSMGIGLLKLTIENSAVASGTTPSEYRFILSYDGQVLGTAAQSEVPNGIVEIGYDATQKTVTVKLTGDTVAFIPQGGTTAQSSISIADKIGNYTFTNDTITLSQTGSWSINRHMSNFSLWTAGCPLPPEEPSDNTSSDSTSSEGTGSETPGDIAPGYYETDQWTPVSIVSSELKGKVSEGCQWELFAVLDEGSNGQLGFICVDVTSPYKTTNGGKTWNPASIGWAASGSQCVAIDPKNANHVIGIGNSATTNTAVAQKNGVYYSEDAGDTWEHTYFWMIGSMRIYHEQVVFDESSYDAENNMCMTVYWSSEDNTSNANNNPALHKSVDGGRTWTVVNSNFGGCHLEINPDGTLYAAKVPCYLENGANYDMGSTEIYKSTDGGVNFTRLDIDSVRSMETIRTKPDTLYVGTTDGFYISENKGSTFTKVNTRTFPSSNQLLSVANNGLNMSVQANAASGGSTKLYSNDGGVTWKYSVTDAVILKTSFMPLNPRACPSSFSGTDPNTVISVYGDTVIRSVNGGKTWSNSNLGINVICTDKMIFNINNENLLLVPSQDYNGAYSTDGGETFTYLPWSGERYGGMTYGGYILDANTMFTCCTDGWLSNNLPRYIYTTFDGGNTINRNRTSAYQISLNADVVSMGAVNNNLVGFIGNMRTADGAETFTSMETVYNSNGSQVSGAMVLGVWCVDYNTGRLYGRDNQGYLVYSDNNGVSWTEFAAYNMERRVLSISCDKNGNVYLFTCRNGGGETAIQKTTVATGTYTDINVPFVNASKVWMGSFKVDFYYPDIMYAATGESTYPKDFDIPMMYRTENGGQSWVTLSKTSAGGNTVTKLYPGGNITNIVINYSSNEVWTNFSCRGLWTIGRVIPNSAN